MAYLVLGQKVPPDNYRDEIGALYNYPRRYWKRITSGDHIIYHQPRLGRQGMVYFGMGTAGDIESDPFDPTRRNAEIMDFTPFPKPVRVNQHQRFVEPLIRSPVDMLGNAVREISEATAIRIVRESGAVQPWDWSGDQPGPVRAPSNNELSVNDLESAIRRFDEKYGALTLDARSSTLSSFHRPSSIGKLIKRLYGSTCWICGSDGFLRRDGTKYAETHHMEEVSTGAPGLLASPYIIVVCANCHRKLHYGDTRLHRLDAGWLLTINGEAFTILDGARPKRR